MHQNYFQPFLFKKFNILMLDNCKLYKTYLKNVLFKTSKNFLKNAKHQSRERDRNVEIAKKFDFQSQKQVKF